MKCAARGFFAIPANSAVFRKKYRFVQNRQKQEKNAKSYIIYTEPLYFCFSMYTFVVSNSRKQILVTLKDYCDTIIPGLAQVCRLALQKLIHCDMKRLAALLFSLPIVAMAHCQVITYENFKEVIPFVQKQDFKAAFEHAVKLLGSIRNDSSDLRVIVTYMNILSASGMAQGPPGWRRYAGRPAQRWRTCAHSTACNYFFTNCIK